jgi:hypothetical protein
METLHTQTIIFQGTVWNAGSVAISSSDLNNATAPSTAVTLPALLYTAEVSPIVAVTQKAFIADLAQAAVQAPNAGAPASPNASPPQYGQPALLEEPAIPPPVHAEDGLPKITPPPELTQQPPAVPAWPAPPLVQQIPAQPLPQAEVPPVPPSPVPESPPATPSPILPPPPVPQTSPSPPPPFPPSPSPPLPFPPPFVQPEATPSSFQTQSVLQTMTNSQSTQAAYSTPWPTQAATDPPQATQAPFLAQDAVGQPPPTTVQQYVDVTPVPLPTPEPTPDAVPIPVVTAAPQQITAEAAQYPEKHGVGNTPSETLSEAVQYPEERAENGLAASETLPETSEDLPVIFGQPPLNAPNDSVQLGSLGEQSSTASAIWLYP